MRMAWVLLSMMQSEWDGTENMVLYEGWGGNLSIMIIFMSKDASQHDDPAGASAVVHCFALVRSLTATIMLAFQMPPISTRLATFKVCSGFLGCGRSQDPCGQDGLPHTPAAVPHAVSTIKFPSLIK